MTNSPYLESFKYMISIKERMRGVHQLRLEILTKEGYITMLSCIKEFAKANNIPPDVQSYLDKIIDGGNRYLPRKQELIEAWKSEVTGESDDLTDLIPTLSKEGWSKQQIYNMLSEFHWDMAYTDLGFTDDQCNVLNDILAEFTDWKNGPGWLPDEPDVE